MNSLLRDRLVPKSLQKAPKRAPLAHNNKAKKGQQPLTILVGQSFSTSVSERVTTGLWWKREGGRHKILE